MGVWRVAGWHCHQAIELRSRHLQTRTNTVAPQELDAFGTGPGIAAELLVAAGHTSNRIRSKAAFAELWVASHPRIVGRTARHRLDRGGNRQANAPRITVRVIAPLTGTVCMVVLRFGIVGRVSVSHPRCGSEAVTAVTLMVTERCDE